MTFTSGKWLPLCLALSGALLAAACSDSDSSTGGGGGAPSAGQGGDAGEAPSTAGTGNTAGSAPSDAGAAGAAPSEAGAGAGGEGAEGGEPGAAGASGSIAMGGGGGAPSGRLMIPCEVNAIYTQVCQNCHSSPPLNEAPFPLVTLQDMQDTAIAQYGAISAGSMPKGSALEAAQKDLLLDWLMNGALGVPEARCP
jgi:hypothetical protein